MSAVHVAAADAASLKQGDLVEQAGVIYRVTYVDGFHLAGAGWRAERVYFVATHDADGEPMPESDAYSCEVHIPTQSLGQIRWWGTRHALAARIESEITERRDMDTARRERLERDHRGLALHRLNDPNSTCGGQVTTGRELFDTDFWCVYCGKKWNAEWELAE